MLLSPKRELFTKLTKGVPNLKSTTEYRPFNWLSKSAVRYALALLGAEILTFKVFTLKG